MVAEPLVERQNPCIVRAGIPRPESVLKNFRRTVDACVESKVCLANSQKVLDVLMIVVDGNDEVRCDLALNTYVEAPSIGGVKAGIDTDGEDSGLEDIVGEGAERSPEKVTLRASDGGAGLI